jgi:hypothetical protein
LEYTQILVLTIKTCPPLARRLELRTRARRELLLRERNLDLLD